MFAKFGVTVLLLVGPVPTAAVAKDPLSPNKARYRFSAQCHNRPTGAEQQNWDLGLVYAADEPGLIKKCSTMARNPFVDDIQRVDSGK
jgi:hypothetical protein